MTQPARAPLRRTSPFCLAIFAIASFVTGSAEAAEEGPRKPNVVLIMTDDQGYGDIHSHGNETIRTPALDRFREQCVRLTNFHVDPTCSPTRSALLTGRYSARVGVWHTIMGRSILRGDEIVLAQPLAAAGYRTMMIGKWHLGDQFPYRPQDRGFHEAFYHGGGGVGQTPDYWGNDYFDDTYFRNGRPEPQQGYCTDVFFAEAAKFATANEDRPFFLYLATNAPHGPYRVDPKYSEPYLAQGMPKARAQFWGMITNIDENVGRLLKTLEDLGIADDTIIIFMTDNGTAAGIDQAGGFNAGMRGSKGSAYEGGHRVPCFLRWPGHFPPREVATLTAHFDLFPTLIELCRAELPRNVALDGRSLAPWLRGETPNWPERTLVVQSHRIEHPEPWRQSAVLTDRWRLIDGRELFDIQADPGQKKNLAQDQPKVVSELRAAYEKIYASQAKRFDEYVPLVLGAAEENPVRLNCMDWHAKQEQIPWDQSQVAKAPLANGFWAVDVRRPGRYAFTLYRQPPPGEVPLLATTAKLRLGEVEQTVDVPANATRVRLTVDLPAGPARLQTWLSDAEGRTRGAFYLDAERLND